MGRVNASPQDPEPGRIATRPARQEESPGDLPPYVETSRAYVGRLQALLQRIGTALIGGDFTGEARGDNAVDLQGARADPARVAAGERSIAIGNDNRAGSALSVAIGSANWAENANPLHGSVALGAGNESTGEDSVAVGSNCRAVADRAVAIGDTAHAEDTAALAVGQEAHASGVHSIAVGAAATAGQAILADYALAAGDHAHAAAPGAGALGLYAHALGERSLALGAHARARPAETVVVSGAFLTRRSDLAQDVHEDAQSLGYRPLVHGAATPATIAGEELDLKTQAQAAVTLPAGTRFFVRDLTVVATAASGVSGQPGIRAGTSGSPSAHLPAAACAGLSAAGDCCRFYLAGWETGVTDLLASVTTTATATTLRGRFIWSGQLVEDEP